MTEGSIYRVAIQGGLFSPRAQRRENLRLRRAEFDKPDFNSPRPFFGCLISDYHYGFDRIIEGGLASPSTYTQGYPSGQRGWAQDPLLSASQVRILLPAL